MLCLGTLFDFLLSAGTLFDLLLIMLAAWIIFGAGSLVYFVLQWWDGSW